MCRLFALRATHPTRVQGSLLDGPHALLNQSACDRRGECHDSGWGIGYDLQGQPHVVRSERPARDDPRYREQAALVLSTAVLAHVRRASVGAGALRNTHPFRHGRWLFAHNGTLFGFAHNPGLLRERLPERLRASIEGDTDSEHLFHLFLARLSETAGPLLTADPDEACGALRETLELAARLYPGQGEERSQFNVVVTDGKLLLAARLGHTLYRLERRGKNPAWGDRPAVASWDYHAVCVASEPTTDEPWLEVPQHTLVCVQPDLTSELVPVG
jgi:glutamine amidotransferase